MAASPDRLGVLKTYKLYINGAFPRTESGRSWPIKSTSGDVAAHLSLASRKDLREAVEAARAAQPKWQAATAYNRGQILYRMAEMMEGKRGELASAIAAASPPRSPGPRARKTRPPASTQRSAAAMLSPAGEVAASIDRLIYYAGWCDKYAQVLGCHNPVAGPYYNFTIPEPTGVVAVVAPDAAPLLGLVSLLAPALVPGNTAVVIASNTNPIPAAVLGEVFATSDVPAGVVNLLTGLRGELLSHAATHRDIDAIHAAGMSTEEDALLREGIAENLKRVRVRGGDIEWTSEASRGPDWFLPFVEFKTIWHPAMA